MKKTDTEICSDCKGVIYPFELENNRNGGAVRNNPGSAGVYPFERDNKTSCLCVPADYEQCAECGFDHDYDPAEANHAHDLIAWDASEKFPSDQMMEAPERSRREPG